MNCLTTAINISLAFCMGTDLESITGSTIGQPMAQIFFNSFGQKGTLGLWAIVVLVQFMMGSSMVRCLSCLYDAHADTFAIQGARGVASELRVLA